MCQTQVNNRTLDCAESRTVRTINNKKHMQQQQEQQLIACSKTNYANNNNNTNTNTNNGRIPSTAVVIGHSDQTHTVNDNFAIGNTNISKLTCQLLTAKTADSTATAIPTTTTTINSTSTSSSTSITGITRLKGKTRSSQRLTMMKSYALLPIICIAILAQISSVAGRTLLGKKLILHTTESRMQHHKHLLRYERELAPRHTATPHRHHHHMNTRSLDMNCMDIAKVLRSSKNQAEISLQILKDNVHKYTFPRFNTTPENATESWSLHRLHLSHPYQKSLDRNFTNAIVDHDFSHLEGKTLDEELLKEELIKIYKTIRMLQTAFSRLSDENKKNKLDLVRRYPGFNEMNSYLHTARLELNNNLQNAESAIRTLNITMENFDENAVTFNETNSVKDWLMIVENISFLQYLDRLYAILLKMCNATQ